MIKGMATVCLSALFISGCTTVNLQEMAGSGATAETPASDINVVERAVEKLKTAFASRGFGVTSSRDKMQTATNILLNGLSAHNASSSEGGYADMSKPVSIVLDDMNVARTHIEQTTRAAEIYFEMANSDRDVSEELASLETALLASERAGMGFVQALGGVDAYPSETRSYEDSVEGLRRVTDDFGLRVRSQRAERMAQSSDETS